MKIGYARTAPGETTLALQRAALIAAGCGMIFEDENIRASAVLKPGLASALRAAAAGDTFVVWRLDRLARSIGSLLTDLQLLESLGLGFASIEDDIGPEVDGGFYTHIRALARFGDLVAAARREERDAGDAAPVRKRGRAATIDDARWSELVMLIAPPVTLPGAAGAKLAGVSRKATHKRP
ncbi:recombinase family protein, partial [Sphingomonas koreensis]|uniref:recombinase family protein n=1 Tax=Sphingomonas koreensis TaxID=93064 RepID=UPI000F7DD959